MLDLREEMRRVVVAEVKEEERRVEGRKVAWRRGAWRRVLTCTEDVFLRTG